MASKDQGITKRQYKVVSRTLIFLFDEEGRVLLLKGSPEKNRWAGRLNGIGGHIEAGEDVMEAALRELEEEASISGVNLELCAQIMIDATEDTGVAIFVFKGVYQYNDQLDSRDGELMWISLENLDQYPVLKDLHELLPMVASYKRGSPFIIGKYLFDSNKNLKILFR